MVENLKTIFQRDGLTDDKSLTYICNALLKHNQQGYDYIELKLALNQMAKMEITGDMAIRSAYAAASTMGVDKRKLLESIVHYQTLLVKERDDFDKALQEALKRKVENRKKEILELENKRLSLEENLRKIQEEITQSEHQISTAQQAIETASQDLTQAEKAYHDTCRLILQTMEDDQKLLDRLI